MRVTKLQTCEVGRSYYKSCVSSLYYFHIASQSDGSFSFVFTNFINETGCKPSLLLFDRRLPSRFSIVIIGKQGPMAWLGFWA